ncbi:hypothetical protein QFC19_001242 [Naganishia cerealis]|uniref:Uncharacterized protein n=1 Tax=Naganishia cerealis TaxID=610337 RepID=A0ACC2WIN6_9TREE|nr:hypothetical protein QFC19_001242 [Naganishia cerealis]
MITLGKKGTEMAKRSAQAMLMPAHHYGVSSTELPKVPISPVPSSVESDTTSLLPKLFTTLAQRYATRTGGYTRITKYGSRPGDNAPKCLLSLVDGERDVKSEMVARSVGREVVERVIGSGRGREGLSGVLEQSVREVMEGGKKVGSGEKVLNDKTKENVVKVLAFRSSEEINEFIRTATQYAYEVWALPIAAKNQRTALEQVTRGKNRVPPSSLNATKPTKLPAAGARAPGSSVTATGLGIARGLLGRQPALARQTEATI